MFLFSFTVKAPIRIITSGAKKGRRLRVVPNEFIVQSRISPLQLRQRSSHFLHIFYHPPSRLFPFIAFGIWLQRSSTSTGRRNEISLSHRTHPLLNLQHVIAEEWDVMAVFLSMLPCLSCLIGNIRLDFCCVITHPSSPTLLTLVIY